MLAEKDVKTGELRKDRVATGPLERRRLSLEQVDGFLGLAAFEQRAGLEEEAARLGI